MQNFDASRLFPLRVIEEKHLGGRLDLPSLLGKGRIKRAGGSADQKCQ